VKEKVAHEVALMSMNLKRELYLHDGPRFVSDLN
jgi:hypothetical protein